MIISKTESGSFLRILNQTVRFYISVIFIIFCSTQLSVAGGTFIPAPEKGKTFVNELRGGIFAHNVEDDDSSEDGVDINLEVLFDKPSWRHHNKFINHLITPRPHVGGHINTSDSTNMFYFGLTWNTYLTDRLFFESSFGGAVHDGPLNQVGTLSFGCSLNFRESASLGWDVSEKMNILLTVDHMSNANLCDRNGGLTNAGVRLGYKLN